MCGPNDKVVSLQWREEVGKGLSELYMDCGDGDGEASFTGNPNGIRQELKKECSQGFSSIRGRTEDSRGIVDVSMLCSGEAEPSNLSGGGMGRQKELSCRADHQWPPSSI